jgi:SAM-dependent methyltransferase
MTTTVDAGLAGSWITRWDAQQERYIADREERFAVIGDVVERALAERPAEPATVLDLGCGPGSLAGRLATRLAGTRIIGLDADPLLLALARAHYGDAVEFVHSDLLGTDWLRAVPNLVDAAVSTTALHWLDPEPLAALYTRLARRLRPGGVFVNGDHMPTANTRINDLARTVRTARAERAGVSQNEEWGQWWDAVRADPALGALVDQRSSSAIAHHGGNSLSVAEQADLLRQAGFAEVGTVWQSGDDHVLVAIR